MSYASETTPKLWGGRFTGSIDPLMEVYNASLPYGKFMYREDLEGSKVYVKALQKLDLISIDEVAKIEMGLDEICNEWSSGTFEVKKGDEDIHTANERRLGELIGVHISGKIHTGRSRNDQVATDLRLYVVRQLEELSTVLSRFISVLLSRASDEIEVLFPGYTHLQRAQPIRWSHWLASHATYFVEDYKRLKQIKTRINQLPLGSGALAGHPYGIDREFLRKELNFGGIIGNSLTAVGDRDFVSEVLFWCSLLMIHMSRFSEDLILYSSAEFGFVQLADAYSTGSSLMPQKKNPDSLELLRGKSGRLFGNMCGFLMTMKSLPSTYNKDMAEDKRPLFDSLETTLDSILIATGVASTLSIDEKRMHDSLSMDMLATDLADYLVRKGVPFRETHHISGECVSTAEKSGLTGIDKLSLQQLQSIDKRFGEDVRDVFDFQNSVEKRSSPGGTAKAAVFDQIENLLNELK